MAEHTEGKLEIIDGFGQTEDDPRCFIGTAKQVLFATVGGNDKANAHKLLRRWNSHDKLLAACKRGHQRLLEMGQRKSHRTVSILAAAIAEAEKA